jgi:hypothetical protein
MDKVTENRPVPTPSILGEYIAFKNSRITYQVTPNKETLFINIIQ